MRAEILKALDKAVTKKILTPEWRMNNLQKEWINIYTTTGEDRSELTRLEQDCLSSRPDFQSLKIPIKNSGLFRESIIEELVTSMQDTYENGRIREPFIGGDVAPSLCLYNVLSYCIQYVGKEVTEKPETFTDLLTVAQNKTALDLLKDAGCINSSKRWIETKSLLAYFVRELQRDHGNPHTIEWKSFERFFEVTKLREAYKDLEKGSGLPKDYTKALNILNILKPTK